MRLLLSILLALPLLAESDEQRRTAHPQLFALTELARAAPPEFAARGLLRLLDAQAIPTQDWQLQLANQALSLAASARHPRPKRLAPGLSAPDSHAMLWNVAYASGLDSLSLYLRAIAHIRRIDPAAAKKAFSEIPRPIPAQSSCKDPLLDDISSWYQSAARLQQDPLPILHSIQSHQEIAPAIDLIFEHPRSPEELDTLAGALGEKLSQLSPSSRPFSAALFDVPRKLKHLLTVLDSRQRPTAPLASGWRAWMTAGLQAPACDESRIAGPNEKARLDAFNLFNDTLQPALPAELLQPAGPHEATEVEPFTASPSTNEQAALFRRLLFGPNSRALSPAEKDTPEWREQMQKFLQSIEARTRSAEESDLAFFYRQSQLWAAVLMAAPAGPTRDAALQRYVAFLLANSAHIDPLLWFSQLDALASIARSLHGDDFHKTLHALHLTAHPVLRLFAELENAYPSRPSPATL